MNVLLVDSDTENIKNFRTYLRGAYPQIKIVGNFTDPNKDIFAVINELAPSLIIADIKFFGGARYMHFMDIHNQFPDIRFIVYGTYNETDYMKRAREFGVIDFMYRPVKPADLSRCLDEALSQHKKAETEKKQTQIMTQNYHERLFQYEELFLRALAQGHIRNEHEINSGFSYFNIPFDKGFSVFIVRTDHFKTIALTLDEKEKHLLTFKIFNTVQQQLRDYNAQAFVMAFHAVAVILCGSYAAEEKIFIGDSIKQAVFAQAGVRVTVGIGRSYDSPSDIAVSYREADAAFRYRHRMGYNAVIPFEFVEPENHITYRYPIEREDRLIYAAVAGDYNYCKQLLSELFGVLKSIGVLPDNLISKITTNVMIRISRYLSEQNLPLAQQVARFFPAAAMLALTTPDEGQKFMDGALKSFCAFVQQYYESNYGELHEAAKYYIKENYSEHFSVGKMAARLNTTPENLNKVFMEREHTMLYDYVMWVRVYEAQQLLRGTEAEEEEIATAVGFDDVKYFRSVFKKYDGESPAEYRQRAKAEADSEAP